MRIQLYGNDDLRIDGSSDKSHFVDIDRVGYDGIGLTLFTMYQYIEIRKKDDKIKVFNFKRKSDKRDCDFGWWEDAEVIYSINEQVVN